MPHRPHPTGDGVSPPRAVVVEGLAGVVVGATDDGRLVVGDLVDAHATEPRHQRLVRKVVLKVPQPPVAIVFLIVGLLSRCSRRVSSIR